MTSPSRRKHLTTRRNTRQENSRASRGAATNWPLHDDRAAGTRRPALSIDFHRPSRIGAGAMATALIAALSVAILVQAATAKELQWRRARVPSTQTVRSTPQQSQWSRAAVPNTARAASPSKAMRRDSAIKQVAYEEDATGLQLTDASTGQTALKSVVVNSDGESNADFHAAQLPLESVPATTPADGASRYEEELRTPFGTDLPPEAPSTVDTPPETTPTGDAPTDIAPPSTTPTDTAPSETTSPATSESLFGEPPAREIESIDELDIESMPLPDNDTQMRTNGQEQRPADLPPSTLQTPQGIQPPNDDRLPVGPDGRPLPTEPTTSDELVEEREKVLGVCSEELRELKSSTLHDVNLAIGVTGTEGEDFPFECTIDDGTWHEGRAWEQTTYMWKASALCHKPLYFENEQLERYGHSWGPCLDPLVSGAHFFTRLPVLPYCMGVEPPHECIYALGHYRPGSCAPYMINPIPISPRGAIFQGGAVVGAAAILP